MDSIKTIKKEGEVIKQKLSSIFHESSNLLKFFNEFSKKHTNLQEELNDSKKQSLELSQKLSNQENEEKQLRKKIHEKDLHIQSLNKEINELKKKKLKNETIIKENKTLQGKILYFKKEEEKLKKEMKKIESCVSKNYCEDNPEKFREIINKHRQKACEMKKEKESIGKEFESFKDSVKGLRDENATLISKNLVLNEKYEKLMKKLKETGVEQQQQQQQQLDEKEKKEEEKETIKVVVKDDKGELGQEMVNDVINEVNKGNKTTTIKDKENVVSIQTDDDIYKKGINERLSHLEEFSSSLMSEITVLKSENILLKKQISEINISTKSIKKVERFERVYRNYILDERVNFLNFEYFKKLEKSIIYYIFHDTKLKDVQTKPLIENFLKQFYSLFHINENFQNLTSIEKKNFNHCMKLLGYYGGKSNKFFQILQKVNNARKDFFHPIRFINFDKNGVKSINITKNMIGKEILGNLNLHESLIKWFKKYNDLSSKYLHPDEFKKFITI